MNRYQLSVFRIIAMLGAPLVFLLVLEMGLRLVGWGYDTRVFVEEKGMVRSNWSFTFKYFPWSVARPMKFVQFSAKKETGALRIFVLGGSAAQGFPAEEFGISSQLRVLLQQDYPERKIEVINTAITAVNSHVVLPVAKACLKYDPDFLIVYLGNNEVVGPHGAGTVFTGFGRNLTLLRFGDSIKSMRWYQMLLVLTGWHKTPTGTWRGMEYFLEHTLNEDDERLRIVYEHFNRNLADLISAASKKDCPVILSTVGVNLKDCPPFASTESTPANTQFQTGLLNLDAGKTEEALVAFKKARDLDELRFRADSKINAVIREQEARHEGQVILVDSERLFEKGESGSLSVPGDDYFYDHVHLSFSGNFKVAQAIVEAIVSQAGPSSTGLNSMASVALALAYSGWDQLQIARQLTEQLFNKPPFINQWRYREAQISRKRALRKLSSRFASEAMDESAGLFENALMKHPGDTVLKRRLSRLLTEKGETQKAYALLLQAASESPGNFEVFFELGQVCTSLKKFEEAEKYIEKILKHNPYAIEARNAYLLLLFNSKRFEEAARYNETLIGDHPADPDFRYVYALILNAQGKREAALDQLGKAIRLDPVHGRARSLMIETLRRGNELDQALQVARTWTVADPESAEALDEEATLLSLKQDLTASIERYRKAIEIDPDFVTARSNYVQLMARFGHIHEAVQFLSDQLAADPEILEGHSMLGLALDVAGRRKEAVSVFMTGLEREPNDTKILRELAWIKATSKDARWRNGPEALTLAKRAVELAPTDPDFHQVLAAAYAENRQFDAAVNTARYALQLAENNKNTGLSQLIMQCIPAYENNQPIRAD